VLRFYENLPYDQIASELGVSVGTVKAQVSTGLLRLRITRQRGPRAMSDSGTSIDPASFEAQVARMLKGAVAGVGAPAGLAATVQLGVLAPNVIGLFSAANTLAPPAG